MKTFVAQIYLSHEIISCSRCPHCC